MHYKLVMGVPVCLGQWVTKIKKQNEINDIIYIYVCVCVRERERERERETHTHTHKFIKIKLSMFD